MPWNEWWVWAVAAIVFAIGEVILPSYVLLGFGIGAGVVALILAIGGAPALWITGSMAVLVLSFAVISLVAWLLLRWALGVNRSQVKTFDHDINED